MTSIWHFSVDKVHDIPKGARPVYVGVRASVLTVWLLIPDTNAPKERREFFYVGTGQEVPGGSSYLGSVKESAGFEYFWHIFEKVHTS